MLGNVHIIIRSLLLLNNNRVDKDLRPDRVGRLRNKMLSAFHMSKITSETSASGKKMMSTKYGLKDSYNPLLNLELDLHKLV